MSSRAVTSLAQPCFVLGREHAKKNVAALHLLGTWYMFTHVYGTPLCVNKNVNLAPVAKRNETRNETHAYGLVLLPFYNVVFLPTM